METQQQVKKQIKVVKVFGDQVPPVELIKGGPVVRRCITKAREGSDRFMMGVSLCPPHQPAPLEWAYSETDEVYYMVSGEKFMEWEDPDGNTGTVTITAGEAAYLPSGVRFRSWNRGNIPYMLVYCTCPPLE